MIASSRKWAFLCRTTIKLSTTNQTTTSNLRNKLPSLKTKNVQIRTQIPTFQYNRLAYQNHRVLHQWRMPDGQTKIGLIETCSATKTKMRAAGHTATISLIQKHKNRPIASQEINRTGRNPKRRPSCRSARAKLVRTSTARFNQIMSAMDIKKRPRGLKNRKIKKK